LPKPSLAFPEMQSWSATTLARSTQTLLRAFSLKFSPGSLRSRSKASRCAREFAGLVGEVVNATVSRAPVTFVELEDSIEFEGFVAHAPAKVPAPFSLEGGGFLFLYQHLCLRRREKYLTTLGYRYVYQSGESDESQIFRFEYEREPEDGYGYPRFHLHINATPNTYEGEKEFPSLHIPTGRVTIEDVVRHLVTEHSVGPISPAWEKTLAQAEESFREIQRKRLIV
jgi:hypothetical protein